MTTFPAHFQNEFRKPLIGWQRVEFMVVWGSEIHADGSSWAMVGITSEPSNHFASEDTANASQSDFGVLFFLALSLGELYYEV